MDYYLLLLEELCILANRLTVQHICIFRYNALNKNLKSLLLREYSHNITLDVS
jgi:hypothetical protein